MIDQRKLLISLSLGSACCAALLGVAFAIWAEKHGVFPSTVQTSTFDPTTGSVDYGEVPAGSARFFWTWLPCGIAVITTLLLCLTAYFGERAFLICAWGIVATSLAISAISALTVGRFLFVPFAVLALATLFMEIAFDVQPDPNSERF